MHQSARHPPVLSGIEAISIISDRTFPRHSHDEFGIGVLIDGAQDRWSGRGLTHAHLDDFVSCYNPQNRHARKATWSEEEPNGRWRAYSRETLLQRDKASLDLFWLKDATMTDLDNLPEPDILMSEIMENLEAAMEQFVAASRA